MNFGNRLVEFYDGEGRREMYRGSGEPGYSTRKVAAIALWDRQGIGRGTMTVPFENLKGIKNIRDLSGFILWVEVAYGDDNNPLGVSSLERAEWTRTLEETTDIDIDYFKE